jgi:KUP system potassium uptake protein
MITPAISVLSAVEGLHIATPLFDPFVVVIAVAILVGLFFFQSRGTTGVGKVFGPVTILWFLSIAFLGVHQIFRAPIVLAAINPWHGVEFFVNNGGAGFVVLGAVFLVVTGGEALYADIGHFGTAPIRLTWFVIVLPALVLNYFGQGSLLLLEPESAVNPFYRMVPSWALYPMVGLATAAAVIASQAIISGAFSLTMQAIQPVIVNGEVMIGATLPAAAPVYPIPSSPYVFAYVNGQRVLVEPAARKIVYVVR